MKTVARLKWSLLVLLSLLLSFNLAFAQVELPQCALTCTNDLALPSTCTNNSSACICHDSGLQTQLTGCVRVSCTVKEGLITQNVTATACSQPVRNRTSLLESTAIAFFVVTTVFVVARITARLPFVGGNLGLDDWLIVLIWSLTLTTTIFQELACKAGLGKDIYTIPFNNITKILKLCIVLERIYIPTVWLTKISILLLYLRLFPDEVLQYRVKIGLVLCFVTGFCLFWADFFQCWPLSYAWNFWDQEHSGSCSNLVAQGWANSSLNIVADLAIFLLPQPSLWRLTLTVKKKLNVILVFSVGLFVTVVSMIRMDVLKNCALSTNPTWDFIDLALWSTVELNVGVICACMPGMRNFYTRVIKGVLLKNKSGSSHAASPPDSSAEGSGQSSVLRKVFRPNDESILIETGISCADEPATRPASMINEKSGIGANSNRDM